MARYGRLDPDYPDSVLFATKLGQADAERVIELAQRTGVGRSEFIRAAVLRELERADTPPPEGG